RCRPRIREQAARLVEPGTSEQVGQLRVGQLTKQLDQESPAAFRDAPRAECSAAVRQVFHRYLARGPVVPETRLLPRLEIDSLRTERGADILEKEERLRAWLPLRPRL